MADSEAPSSPPAPPASNTGTIVILSVLGLVVVGGGVYAATRGRDRIAAEVMTARELAAEHRKKRERNLSVIQTRRQDRDKQRAGLDRQIADMLQAVDRLRAQRRAA